MAILDEPNEMGTTETRTRLLLRTVRESLSLKLAVLGVAFVLLGMYLRTGVYAALFPIWGGGLVLIGVVSYVAIWRTRR